MTREDLFNLALLAHENPPTPFDPQSWVPLWFRSLVRNHYYSSDTYIPGETYGKLWTDYSYYRDLLRAASMQVDDTPTSP